MCNCKSTSCKTERSYALRGDFPYGVSYCFAFLEENACKFGHLRDISVIR